MHKSLDALEDKLEEGPGQVDEIQHDKGDV